jgi:hypothetical protein
LLFLESNSEHEAMRELFIRMLSMKQFQGYVTSILMILPAMLWNAVISWILKMQKCKNAKMQKCPRL